MSLIKNKYKSVQTLKQKNGKLIERVTCNGLKQIFIAKSYSLEDSKSIDNEIWVYKTLKEPHLHGFCEVK